MVVPNVLLVCKLSCKCGLSFECCRCAPHENKLQCAGTLVHPKIIGMVRLSFGGSRFGSFLWALSAIMVCIMSVFGSLVVSCNLFEDILLCAFFVGGLYLGIPVF